tara:strand:- start:5514 stop:6461 length:948 start_codon:yes stop_codon:yes gene_type:complete
MPIWYASIQSEHAAVRTKSGVFDVSHMGLFTLAGSINAFEQLQRVSCQSLTNIQSGKLVYTFLLNESGGILDDVVVGQSEPGHWFMVVNASNQVKLQTWLRTQCPDLTLTICNAHDGLIAWQGPDVTQLVDLGKLRPWTHEQQTIFGHSVRVMRTGYTGEDGVEIWAKHAAIQAIWDALMALNVVPCGLGARDTLRIEAGLPLYGQELDETITPYQTRYRRLVKTHAFIGSDALQAVNPTETTMVGLVITGGAIARTGAEILGGGMVTSGTRVDHRSIAMARVPSAQAQQAELQVCIRGRQHTAMVVPLPFLTHA